MCRCLYVLREPTARVARFAKEPRFKLARAFSA